MTSLAVAPEVHPEGVYPSVPEQVYLTDRGSLSASGMKQLLRSPAHYLAALEEPFKSRATELGTVVHSMVLGEGAGYVAIEGNRNRNDVKARVAQAEDQGLIVLKPEELAQAQAMAAAVRTHPLAGRLLTSPGRSEVSMYWHDPEYDVVRRCRWDRLTDDGIGVDLKTTISADPADLPRTVVKWGYDLSAANYLDIAAGLGAPVEAYALVFVEKTPPYPVVVAELDEAFLERGRALLRQALETYRRCLDTHTWPGYLGASDFTTLAPPRWADLPDRLT